MYYELHYRIRAEDEHPRNRKVVFHTNEPRHLLHQLAAWIESQYVHIEIHSLKEVSYAIVELD